MLELLGSAWSHGEHVGAGNVEKRLRSAHECSPPPLKRGVSTKPSIAPVDSPCSPHVPSHTLIVGDYPLLISQTFIESGDPEHDSSSRNNERTNMIVVLICAGTPSAFGC